MLQLKNSPIVRHILSNPAIFSGFTQRDTKKSQHLSQKHTVHTNSNHLSPKTTGKFSYWSYLMEFSEILNWDKSPIATKRDQHLYESWSRTQWDVLLSTCQHWSDPLIKQGIGTHELNQKEIQWGQRMIHQLPLSSRSQQQTSCPSATSTEERLLALSASCVSLPCVHHVTVRLDKGILTEFLIPRT